MNTKRGKSLTPKTTGGAGFARFYFWNVYAGAGRPEEEHQANHEQDDDYDDVPEWMEWNTHMNRECNARDCNQNKMDNNVNFVSCLGCGGFAGPVRNKVSLQIFVCYPVAVAR